MGGAESAIAMAKKAYEKGDYRWVAMVMNHVVFADPDNEEARHLEADALEQMGYQAASAPWRNFFLTGALELRHGVPTNLPPIDTASADTVKAMPLDMLFDYLGVRLNGHRAAGLSSKTNMIFPDTGEKYSLVLENSVLNYNKRLLDDAHCTITITRESLDSIILGESDIPREKDKGNIKVEGDVGKFREFMTLLDTFNSWFNIVTP